MTPTAGSRDRTVGDGALEPALPPFDDAERAILKLIETVRHRG